MNISTATANLIGLVFILACAFMFIACTPFYKDDPKPYLLLIGEISIKKKEISGKPLLWFASIFFPFLTWETGTTTPAPAAAGTAAAGTGN
jgi:hypothetical protein